jgi:hypothetical protein
MTSLLDLDFNASKFNTNDKLDLSPEIVPLMEIANDAYIASVRANINAKIPKNSITIDKTRRRTRSDLTLGLLPLKLFFTNRKVQREQLASAVANKSGVNYQHDLVSVIKVHRYTNKTTGEIKVTVWDGMHTVLATLVTLLDGWIDFDGDPLDYEMQCQIKDYDMADFEKGESEAIEKFVNFHQSITKMSPYYMLRANACRAMLGSNDNKAVQALQLFDLFHELGIKMVPTKTTTIPLATTHINGIQRLTNFGTPSFDMSYLKSALLFIKKYRAADKGIHSSFLMMLTKLYEMIDSSNYTVDFDEDKFAEFVKKKGGMNGTGSFGTGLYSKFIKDNDRVNTDRDYFGLCFVIHAYVKEYGLPRTAYPSFGGDWKALGLEA